MIPEYESLFRYSIFKARSEGMELVEYIMEKLQ